MNRLSGYVNCDTGPVPGGDVICHAIAALDRASIAGLELYMTHSLNGIG